MNTHLCFRHRQDIVMSRCEHTTNTAVHIKHYCHRNEKRAHRWKNNVSFVLIISTFELRIGFVSAWLIPECTFLCFVPKKKDIQKTNKQSKCEEKQNKKKQFIYVRMKWNVKHVDCMQWKSSNNNNNGQLKQQWEKHQTMEWITQNNHNGWLRKMHATIPPTKHHTTHSLDVYAVCKMDLFYGLLWYWG